MSMKLSGPMFEPAEDEWRESIFRKSGGHYNVFGTKTDDLGLAFLRQWFPEGEANEMNIVFFSTSGVHGMYTTLEELEASTTAYGFEKPPDDSPDEWCWPTVTFLVVQPRLVSMTYGNARVRSQEDIEFLRKLRASSWGVAQGVGREAKP